MLSKFVSNSETSNGLTDFIKTQKLSLQLCFHLPFNLKLNDLNQAQ